MITVQLGADKYIYRGQIVDWCCEHISKNYGFRFPDRVLWGDDWGTTSDGYGYTKWHFLNDNDALLFKLRWM